jgi:hypothetical protein
MRTYKLYLLAHLAMRLSKSTSIEGCSLKTNQREAAHTIPCAGYAQARVLPIGSKVPTWSLAVRFRALLSAP